MKTFTLVREVSGYTRGYQTVEVRANTLDEAKELANQVGEVDTEIVRDDRSVGEWHE